MLWCCWKTRATPHHLYYIDNYKCEQCSEVHIHFGNVDELSDTLLGDMSVVVLVSHPLEL